jgi:transposase
MGSNLEPFKKNADHETHLFDSTTIKVHQNACGAIGKSPRKQAIGKTAGGWTSKIHLVTDALGLPIHFLLTVGNCHDIKYVKYLVVKSYSSQVIMDGAYDSHALRTFISQHKSYAIIPYRKNSLQPGTFDKSLYKERHLVECLINRMKNYRRIATRFDKLAITYQSMIILSFILIWLRF